MTKHEAHKRAERVGGSYVYYSPAMHSWRVVPFETIKLFTISDLRKVSCHFVNHKGKIEQVFN